MSRAHHEEQPEEVPRREETPRARQWCHAAVAYTLLNAVNSTRATRSALCVGLSEMLVEYTVEMAHSAEHTRRETEEMPRQLGGDAAIVDTTQASLVVVDVLGCCLH